MSGAQTIWLIHNDASGSNSAEALDTFHEHCQRCGLEVARVTSFPSDELPSPAMLDDAGIGIAALFAGDGTINAALGALAGWGGKVLVLPGGTMNLLYHRLFGDLPMEAAIAAVGDGSAATCRPPIVESDAGTGYAGLLAGPGTSWSSVREAMRNEDLLELVQEAGEAFTQTIDGPPVRCAEPALGKPEGYPLIQLAPTATGLEISAYHAETGAEFTKQLFALLRRDFRAGPHDTLGTVDSVTLATVGAEALALLFDGEPADAEGKVTFRLGTASVDMLTTLRHG